MVTMVSKLLLLVALLGSIENGASSRDYKSRGLSFEHTSVSDSHDIEESEDSPSTKYKSGKGGKNGDYVISKKSGKKSEKRQKRDNVAMTYDENDGYDNGDNKSKRKSSKKDGNGNGEGMKSVKGDKHLHPDSDYEAKYEVVVNYNEDYTSKSSKNRPTIPDFEFIQIGQKSSKASKTSVGEEVGYYGSDGVKSEKAYKNSKSVKAPTISPAPTVNPFSSSSPPPTEVGSFGIGIPLYSLAYKPKSKTKPKNKELNELKEATRSYLDDYFFDEFNEDDFTVYEQFITDIDDISASNNMPTVVSYKSIARFDQLSLIKPMPEQLGSAVEEAFTGLAMIKYEDWLKEMLPSNNMFVGSKVQYYQGGSVPDSTRRGIGATGIAASAVAFTLLVAGVVLYKSKSDGRGSKGDKLNKTPGDMTVAGETFAGETYDGTASVSAASADYARRYNDEEEGTKIDNLGSTPESHDADSVKPTWSDDEIEDKGNIFRIAPSKILSAFRSSITSAPRTTSFEDVALQAPASGSRFQANIMPDPSSSDDEASQMSDSELSQFVASTKQADNQTSGGHTLEIKSILSQDSMDENTTGDLSVRDNSSRRLRTVAEIEALLSSELKDDNSNSGSRTSRSNIQTQDQANRPRTVEEIESLLTADDDDTIVEVPYSDDEEESSIE